LPSKFWVIVVSDRPWLCVWDERRASSLGARFASYVPPRALC
jgi:hypothetical protein